MGRNMKRILIRVSLKSPSVVCPLQAENQERFRVELLPKMKGQIHIPQVVRAGTTRKVRYRPTHTCSAPCSSVTPTDADPIQETSEQMWRYGHGCRDQGAYAYVSKVHILRSLLNLEPTRTFRE